MAVGDENYHTNIFIMEVLIIKKFLSQKLISNDNDDNTYA